MKRTILIGAALVAAISTASFAGGNGGKSSKAALVPGKEDGRFNLIYADATPGTVKVKVIDEKGHVLRVDNIENKAGFRQPYNMKDLGPGTYQVLVSDQSGEFTLLARVMETEAMSINKLSDSRFQLVYKDDTSNAATIGIYDEAGELVHTENVKFDSGFSKVFDLSGISSKGFTFEVSSSKNLKRVSL